MTDNSEYKQFAPYNILCCKINYDSLLISVFEFGGRMFKHNFVFHLVLFIFPTFLLTKNYMF